MKRLEAVLSLIPDCRVFADVGCDHGKLLKEVLAAGKAEKLIGSDISQTCLNKAKKLLADRENVTFVCGDGIAAIESFHPDVITVTGMGARTIIGMLERPPVDGVLIFGPQGEEKELRRFLHDHGYKITREITAVEDRRFYPVIRAEIGNSEMDEAQILLGADIYTDTDRAVDDKLNKMLDRISSYRQTRENVKLIETVREVLEWRQSKTH